MFHKPLSKMVSFLGYLSISTFIFAYILGLFVKENGPQWLQEVYAISWIIFLATLLLYFIGHYIISLDANKNRPNILNRDERRKTINIVSFALAVWSFPFTLVTISLVFLSPTSNLLLTLGAIALLGLEIIFVFIWYKSKKEIYFNTDEIAQIFELKQKTKLEKEKAAEEEKRINQALLAKKQALTLQEVANGNLVLSPEENILHISFAFLVSLIVLGLSIYFYSQSESIPWVLLLLGLPFFPAIFIQGTTYVSPSEAKVIKVYYQMLSVCFFMIKWLIVLITIGLPFILFYNRFGMLGIIALILIYIAWQLKKMAEK